MGGICDPGLVQAARIRREKPKFRLVYGVKQAVFLQKNGQKQCEQPAGSKKVVAAGGMSLFCRRAAERCMAFLPLMSAFSL